MSVIFKRINLLNVLVIVDKASEWEIIQKALSIRMPGYQFSDKYNSGWWDGYIKFYENRSHQIPLGLTPKAEFALKKKGIGVVKKGFMVESTISIKFSDKFTSKERDYQREAIKAFLDRRCGIIELPTRSGKTFIFAETARILIERDKNIKIIFITDSTDLFFQAIRDISLVAGIKESEIGKIKGSTIEVDKNITIAMAQTLQSKMKVGNKSKKFVLNFIKSVGFLAVDEIHENAASKPRRSLISKFHPEYFMSLTATIQKNDRIVSMNILKMTGGVAYKVSEDKLQKSGVLAENRVLLLFNNYTQTDDDLDYSQIGDKIIINNKERNEVIVDLVRVCQELKIKLLIIVFFISHGRILSKMTGVDFIHGSTPVEERESKKNIFLKGEGGVLIASKIYKKGITLPSVEALISVSGGKEQSLIRQIRGRILGATETKKKSLFIDILDNYEDYLSEHAMIRINTYEKYIGTKSIDIIQPGIDFRKELKEYMKGFFDGKK